MDIISEPLSGKPCIVDPNTGEILFEDRDSLDMQLAPVARSNKTEQSRRIRRYRYKLQRVAQKCLMDTATPKGNRFRVCDCHRLANPSANNVSLTKSRATGRADWRNLVRCGQVWTCPVCSSKVAGVRRDELQKALSDHLSAGKLAVMVTLTTRHGVKDYLPDLLQRLGNASARLRGNTRVRDLRKGHGFIGQIRALEVTYGDANGWHPHFHEVWLFDKDSENAEALLERLRATLQSVWVKSCDGAGLPAPVPEVGCRVDQVHTPSDYIAKGVSGVDGDGAKWGIADEVARWSAKSAKKHNRYNPFDLLEVGRFDLFREYALAFYGKRQLTWSPGLKKRFAVAEVTDEEIVADDPADGVPVIGIPREQWTGLRRREPEVVAIAVERIEREPVGVVLDWLISLGVDAFAFGQADELASSWGSEVHRETVV